MTQISNIEILRGKRMKKHLVPVHRHNLRSMASILSDDDDASDSNVDIHSKRLDESTKSVISSNVSFDNIHIHCNYL